MIVSIDWLREFLEIKESPNELADMLSSSGLEAELNSVPLLLPGVIIGKVESTEKHQAMIMVHYLTQPLILNLIAYLLIQLGFL